MSWRFYNLAWGEMIQKYFSSVFRFPNPMSLAFFIFRNAWPQKKPEILSMKSLIVAVKIHFKILYIRLKTRTDRYYYCFYITVRL